MNKHEYEIQEFLKTSVIRICCHVSSGRDSNERFQILVYIMNVTIEIIGREHRTTRDDRDVSFSIFITPMYLIIITTMIALYFITIVIPAA